MRESLRELFEILAGCQARAQDDVTQLRYDMAIVELKRIMGAAGKLHARVVILAELADDAKFVAEVDRALDRADKSAPRPIKGDQPLPFPPSPGVASPPRRKGKPSK